MSIVSTFNVVNQSIRKSTLKHKIKRHKMGDSEKRIREKNEIVNKIRRNIGSHSSNQPMIQDEYHQV